MVVILVAGEDILLDLLDCLVMRTDWVDQEPQAAEVKSKTLYIVLRAAMAVSDMGDLPASVNMVHLVVQVEEVGMEAPGHTLKLVVADLVILTTLLPLIQTMRTVATVMRLLISSTHHPQRSPSLPQPISPPTNLLLLPPKVPLSTPRQHQLRNRLHCPRFPQPSNLPRVQRLLQP